MLKNIIVWLIQAIDWLFFGPDPELNVIHPLGGEVRLVCVWADYTWCEHEELDEYLMHHSDDFMQVQVPINADVDEYLDETRPQG